ncbi:MAG: GNAT family N-acetyltransferase [Lachnospiraceae bacterium]
MEQLLIRRATEADLEVIVKLLFQVQKVHSDVRPDLFRAGSRKYTDEEIKQILLDDTRPVFVAEQNGQVLGYCFCMHQQHVGSNSLTDVKTLYVDDLCVEENARNMHVGTALYEYVLNYAKQQGYYNVTLNVWADNKKALGFYEKLGLRVQKIGMEKIL